MGVHDLSVYPEVKKLLGIPEDEPIFILRAQDKFSVAAVSDYYGRAGMQEHNRPSLDWFENGNGVIEEFGEWQQTNNTKIPD